MMNDNFSGHASMYSKYRPTYPRELIEYIVSQTDKRNCAWDCGTGNGQVAVQLASFFDKVYATDISEKQMAQAPQRKNVIYQISPAEATGFNNDQFDLVTVAQAIHWFNFDQFYAEVNRTLKHNGVLAVIGYGLTRINPAVDEVINKLYSGILGTYWDPERKYIDEGYRTIPFPMKEMSAPYFEMTVEWTVEDFAGYLNTWSAVKHFIKANHSNPVDELMNELKSAWGSNEKKNVAFPILLRIGRSERGEVKGER
jgi:ubiquinone/menaquinone biosynthesis C-methylase UbiE